jgi:hypothetical protein
MIKKYFEFIKENFNGFNSIGEWVESLYDDDYVKNIVSRYLGEISSDIRLSNAVNLLDDKEKTEIKKQIDNYLKFGIEEKKPSFSTSVDLGPLVESEITMAGKSIFHCFLKTLTALGQKEKDADFENCPEDFLLFFYYKELSAPIVKDIFLRFKSLSTYLDLIDYGKNETNLYFGVKCNGELEYGVCYENRIPIGSFKLTTSVIKWLNNLEAKSAFSLKKELVNLSNSDIITLGKIKTDMFVYNPGYYENKMKPILKDRIISFGYSAVGKWDNGRLDEGEFLNLKNNFTTWVVSKKWSDKVLINLKPGSYWLYFHIKLK